MRMYGRKKGAPLIMSAALMAAVGCAIIRASAATTPAVKLPPQASSRMELFGWNDFWARGHVSFDPAYQQYVDSVRIRFEPGGRPAGTEDRIYWSKKPLTASNHRTDGTYSQSVTGAGPQTLAITGLPPDRDLYLLAVRYNADGTAYTPETTCSELVRTARRLTATPPNAKFELATGRQEFSDWFERQPTRSMVSQDVLDLPGGGFQIIRRPTSEPLEGGVWYGKKVLAPDYDWSVEFTVSFPDDVAPKPKYFTIGAASGTQALVSVSIRDAHSPYPATNPNVPLGFTIQDPGLLDIVPYATQYNYLVESAHPSTQWWPRGTTAWWRRAQGAKTTFRFEYAASTKTVKVYHGEAALYTLSPSRGAAPNAPKRYPATDHYGFGIVPQFLFEDLIEGSSPINIHNVKLQSACPQHYAEWTPGFGHAGYGYYAVPGKYDGALGVNIDDPDHTLGGLAFYAPFATTDEDWTWPASRFTTRLHMGYTVPYDAGEQELTHPRAPRGLAYPYWTARTGYLPGTYRARTPPIAVPEGSRPAYTVFRGLQRAGTLKARLLDQEDVPLTEWRTVNKTIGAAKFPIRAPEASKATSVRCEFEIYYDGSDVRTYYGPDRKEVTYPYALLNSPIYNSLDFRIPDTPSLFVGYAVYFDPTPPTPARE